MASLGTKTNVTLHQNKAPPAWLTKFLKINFYEDEEGECEKHRKKYRTCFCIDCMSEPFCESCTFELLQHNGHRVLQVERCSHKAAIRKKAIEKLVNVTQIQPFVINSHTVFYLQERDTKGKGELMCKICGGRILESNYILCSIACQVRAENAVEIEDNDVVTQSFSTQETMKNHRPSRRKGTPFRSPLF